jgi:hypothetical protein
MPIRSIRSPLGEAWIQRFDVFTERGVPARDIVVEMAKELDAMFDKVCTAVEQFPSPQTIAVPLRCPHCGKSISWP